MLFAEITYDVVECELCYEDTTYCLELYEDGRVVRCWHGHFSGTEAVEEQKLEELLDHAKWRMYDRLRDEEEDGQLNWEINQLEEWIRTRRRKILSRPEFEQLVIPLLRKYPRPQRRR